MNVTSCVSLVIPRSRFKMEARSRRSQLWAFNIDQWTPSEEEWAEALSLIEEEERNRVNRFKFPVGGGVYVTGRHNSSAKSTLIGRLMILALMSREVFDDRKDAQLARTSKNKPCLRNPPNYDFNFNVSHSGSWVVLAWDWCQLVGVDVMKVEVRGRDKRVEYFLKDFKTCFTSHEWDFIQSGVAPTINTHIDADTGRLHRFYWLWTLKEAYIKAVGIGLGFTLDRADFFIQNAEVEEGHREDFGDKEGHKKTVATSKVAIDSQLMPDWKFETCYLDPDHVVTLGYGPQCDADESWKNRTILQAKERPNEEGSLHHTEERSREGGFLIWEVWDFSQLLSALRGSQ